MVSCVGSDTLGDEILALLDEVDLDRHSLAVDPAHPTGTVSVSLDAKGVPTYVIHTDVAWDFMPGRTAWPILRRSASAVCFGSLCQRSPVSRRTIREFLSHTSPDSLRVFDVNLRQSFYDRDVNSRVLRAFKHREAQRRRTAGPCAAARADRAGPPRTSCASWWTTYSLRLIALTRGSHGSILCTPDDVSEHAGYPAQIVDTVGAGDSFTAAIVMGVLNGEKLDRINDSANRLASYVCSQKGAMPRYI